MTDESVARRLAEVAPVAPELVAAFERFEHLSYAELQSRFEGCTDRFRLWVEESANRERPISEWPEYLDRIALDALIERRTWME